LAHLPRKTRGRGSSLWTSGQFELTLEGETAGRAVVIRANDALNNLISARGEAPAPAARR